MVHIAQLDETRMDCMIFLATGLLPTCKIADVGASTKGQVREVFREIYQHRMEKNASRLHGLSEDLDNTIQIAIRAGYPFDLLPLTLQDAYTQWRIQAAQISGGAPPTSPAHERASAVIANTRTPDPAATLHIQDLRPSERCAQHTQQSVIEPPAKRIRHEDCKRSGGVQQPATQPAAANPVIVAPPAAQGDQVQQALFAAAVQRPDGGTVPSPRGSPAPIDQPKTVSGFTIPKLTVRMPMQPPKGLARSARKGLISRDGSRVVANASDGEEDQTSDSVPTVQLSRFAAAGVAGQQTASDNSDVEVWLAQMQANKIGMLVPRAYQQHDHVALEPAIFD